MNAMEQARKHAIAYDRPAVNFFEGALLGNGGMGVVVLTRPDAVVFRFGHNNVWDIRLAERNTDKIGTFEEVFAKIKEIPSHYASFDEDEWYRDYVKMTAENYNFPYPRPMPCGSVLLGFDRRRVEVLGHTLHVADGLCEIHLLVDGMPAKLHAFVDRQADRLWVRWIELPPLPSSAAPFTRLRLMPDPNTPAEFAEPQYDCDQSGGKLSFRQTLPFSEAPDKIRSGHPQDRAFRLTATTAAPLKGETTAGRMEAELAPAAGDFVLCVELAEGLDSSVPSAAAAPAVISPTAAACDEALAAARNDWAAYWSRSGVVLEDEYLERVWYRNLYFFHCAVKPEAICPGLFANWSYGTIGSAWHGDYHMNYNTQQPFWLAFSSNHVDKHLAYVNMVEQILPISRKWAKEYYGLRGAYYPHSAYPVEMNVMPYPVPHWGWEICETPWTVQSLWWHYAYTMDKRFLQDRAFVPIKEAVLFMVDYMKRPDAHGEGWGDDKYHIFPTVVPELYELTPGFRFNNDCIVDLTLTKFLFRSYAQACADLGLEEREAELLAETADILGRFPDYPTAESGRGTVFVSAPGEDAEVIYNVPNGIATIFPGEEHGLHSPPGEYETAVNSFMNHRNEGGNELVFHALAGARLGKLDLERFKRQIAYCTLPNGTSTDMVLQAGGRYSDTLEFDFMGPLGIWFENFALPAVVNECLLQSYNGILRFFPNWPAGRRAEFATLRAVGGFLVSAATGPGGIARIELHSEAGQPVRIYRAWEGAAFLVRGDEATPLSGEVWSFDTLPGETVSLSRTH